MILVDYNQVVIATLFASIGNHHDVDVDEDLLRHMILNSIRAINNKFKNEYGNLVICADGRNSWRKSYFPYYKASRKKNREESEINWEHVFSALNNVRNELIEFFPYKVLHFENAEADDCIGALCHEYGALLGDGQEKILIVSSDKDYIQLQKYSNVNQYDNIRNRWLTNSDPDQYLVEHVLKGDRGDGIPNILSSDDCIVAGVRMKPMTKKRIEEYGDPSNITDETILKNYNRNKLMIDLAMIPEDIYNAIIEEYKNQKVVGRDKLFSYFVSKKLKNLLTDIGDF